VDFIEKKPLYHVAPGSKSYSIATVGCNFRCRHCQNWSISQATEIVGQELPPEQVVENALRTGCDSIAYTYTEPTIFFEYAYDTAVLAHKKGLKNIFVTDGFTTEQPIRKIEPYLSAANVDLKGFTEEFYRNVCGASLQPVLDAIKLYHELGIWLEITTLIIPGYNDSMDDLRGIAQFISDLDPDIPWHVSGFYPTYKLTDAPPTSVQILRKAVEIGKEAGLKYVYEGNVREGIDTSCPSCGETLIVRDGFQVLQNRVKDGKCPQCGAEIAGVDLSKK
jgi:pyruvate formate lyase activating enzyme